LRHKIAASADADQQHDDGGDLKPGHALGLLGTM
jgi:hypothetical protein